MKLDQNCIDIQQDDLATINRPDSLRQCLDIDDAKLSMDLPIVVKYDYIDLQKTDYNFMQEFHQKDTQEYFAKMKKISSSTINNLKSQAGKDFHFYRSGLNGNVRKAVKKIMPKADDDLIVYHVGLYECPSKQACRQTDERSPRVYFALGNYGHIYILFFDPYHELNP